MVDLVQKTFRVGCHSSVTIESLQSTLGAVGGIMLDEMAST